MEIIEEYKKGRNIFLTGGGGVGKTYCINRLKEYLDKEKIISFITTTTGTATLQYKNAQTIHSYSGIGINNSIEKLDKVVNTRRFRDKIFPIIKETETLIIDEVSMLRSDVLELLDAVFKYAKDSDDAFGGIQTIFVGDLLQLTPVVRRDEDLDKPWPFQSSVWSELDFKVINLTKIHRQSDETFINVLKNIRIGRCNEWIENYFQKTSKREFDADPVRLVATNAETNYINNRELEKMDGTTETFEADLDGEENDINRLIKDCPAPEILKLKKGANVIILKNSEDYVNGSMGKYICESSVETWNLEDKCFEDVPCLVIELLGGREVSVPIHTYKKSKEIVTDVFDESDMTYKTDKVEITLASMKQFPIRLGWAITVHRSQGMSLDCIEIDFTKFFTEGQAYVALSRAKNYEGLKCVNFSRHAVSVNKDAYNFYMDLHEQGKL